MTGDKRTIKRARQGYAVANQEAATIIAADPAKYPEASLMQQWADLVLSKAVFENEQETASHFVPLRKRNATGKVGPLHYKGNRSAGRQVEQQ